jgi:hypothetical protein
VYLLFAAEVADGSSSSPSSLNSEDIREEAVIEVVAEAEDDIDDMSKADSESRSRSWDDRQLYIYPDYTPLHRYYPLGKTFLKIKVNIP